MDFQNLAAARYSVRKFDERPVAKEHLDLILRAGQLAPTACNKQPWHALVVASEAGLAKLRMVTGSHFHCTAAIIVCQNTEECWVRGYDGHPAGEVDASIVATHMMLQAADIGVGSTWVMHFIPEACRVEFEIPAHLEPVAILVLGYPAEDAQPAPGHAATKDIAELTTWL